MAAPDLLGQRFGRLTVVSYHGKLGNHRAWNCLCDCGGRTVVRTNALRMGGSRSCGCLQRESAYRHGDGAPGRQTPEYEAWAAMIARCENTKHQFWHRYGGRGIRVCQRWRESYPAFLEDMGRRPAGRSLDRINNDGHYEPGNCRWATRKEQCRNRANALNFTIDGRTMSMSEWARERGKHPASVHRLLRRGLSIEEALA